jgi:hypothetical protein
VENVTEYPHVGTMLNLRGNWKSAWDNAYRKTSLAYNNAVAGGVFFFHSESLASMVIFARAKIWSYLDAVMAITGTGDTASSSFCNKADDSIGSEVGNEKCNRELLSIEIGICDTRTRADMLVMRFFTKLCSSDLDLLVWRVVSMSMQKMSAAVRECPL